METTTEKPGSCGSVWLRTQGRRCPGSQDGRGEGSPGKLPRALGVGGMGSALLRAISYGSVPRRPIASHGAQTHTPHQPQTTKPSFLPRVIQLLCLAALQTLRVGPSSRLTPLQVWMLWSGSELSPRFAGCHSVSGHSLGPPRRPILSFLFRPWWWMSGPWAGCWKHPPGPGVLYEGGGLVPAVGDVCPCPGAPTLGESLHFSKPTCPLWEAVHEIMGIEPCPCGLTRGAIFIILQENSAEHSHKQVPSNLIKVRYYFPNR